MDIIRTIKSRRRDMAITQRDLAGRSGVSLATVKNIERGTGNPSYSTLDKLFCVLGLELAGRLKENPML